MAVVANNAIEQIVELQKIASRADRAAEDGLANMRRGIPSDLEARLAENHRNLARGIGAYRMTDPRHICGAQCEP